MVDKHLVVCSVGAEDIDKARETIDAMCRHAMMGHIIPGFGIDDSLQYMCNSDGVGDPIFYLCFSKHTEFYINKWRGLEYEFRIRDKCPSYFCDKVESEEKYLSTMNLKKIEQ